MDAEASALRARSVIDALAAEVPDDELKGYVLDLRGVGIWLGLAAGLAFVAVLLVGRFALRERLGLLRNINA